MTDSNNEILPSAYDPKQAESHWYARWEESGYFMPAPSPSSQPFSIVMPPPNVTGSLHMGHALNNTLQDVLVRYHRMMGHGALWQPGTDHAGIATQMVVERQLAAEGKTRRELGREKFLERVWAWKADSGGTITRQLRRLGASPAWPRERFTMDEGLSSAVRKVFVQLYKEGLIYRAKRLVNWDPKLHTAISDLEVEQRETKGNLWYFKYPVEGAPGTFITVATTRPETMLGDTAVAVHPEDARYTKLVGKHVVLPLVGRRIPIVADTYSDPEKGTGAVKITPAHDFNDFQVGQRHGLPLINVLDRDANLNDEVPEQYRGLPRFEARKRVVADMEAAGLLEKVEDHVHMVPYGDRSGVVIEPWLTDQWYVDAAKLAVPAIEAVEQGRTEFVPKHWEKTYFEWMRNIQPWCISRQLWWGHQIPAWYGPDGHFFVEESEAEAQAAAKAHYGKDVTLRRDEDVLDTWFSSALWPFSTLGWPERTPELARFYPTTVLVTAFDIIFFWVARMMMMGLHFMREVPFRTVYIHALVRDEHGQKMSKSKGNVIDPLDVLDEHGCDALRFTLTALAMQGRDIKLSVDRIAGYRAFANKIWNASRFVLMRIEGQPPALEQVEAKLEGADRFILSRLAAATAEVHEALQGYRFADAANAIYAFFWNEYCDWYIELVKPRLMGTDADSKRTAQATLIHVLDHALRLLHPMMPFITEEIWQKLPLGERQQFIGMAPYPAALERWRDLDIEATYVLVKDSITAIRNVRAESNVAPSKPIDAVLVVPAAADRQALERHRAEITALARLGKLTLQADKAGLPEQVAVKVLDKLEAVIPLAGLVNFAEEAERLRKQINKTEQERDKMAAKLANENFVARAPAEVIAKDRARVQELDGMLRSLRESLGRAEAGARGA